MMQVLSDRSAVRTRAVVVIPGAALLILVGTLAGCGRSAKVDNTTRDNGLPHTPVGTTAPLNSVVSLPSSAQVAATPVESKLNAYLTSSEAEGRRFELPSIRFEGRDQVRQDPDGALTTLAAVLNAHPKARVRIEVTERNAETDRPRDRAHDRAAAIAATLVRNGVSSDRVSSAGRESDQLAQPRVSLVVTAK